MLYDWIFLFFLEHHLSRQRTSSNTWFYTVRDLRIVLKSNHGNSLQSFLYDRHVLSSINNYKYSLFIHSVWDCQPIERKRQEYKSIFSYFIQITLLILLRPKSVNTPTTTSALRLRCNDISHIERARQRTLRLTITIVCVFVWCWTPYVFMTLW